MTSACHASAAIAVAEARPLLAGWPVAGSITWWRRSPFDPQARRIRLVVATAPPRRATLAAGFVPLGYSMATTQDSPWGDSPSTRRSPARLAQAPAAPFA